MATLIELREERHLCQRGVAARLGISRAHLSNIETGARGMTFEVAHGLALVYSVSLDDLYAAYANGYRGSLRSWRESL